MGIADTEFALEKLREFLALIQAGDDDQIRKLLPLVESIAKQVDSGNVLELRSVALPLGGVSWGPARVEALRLIGIVEQEEDYQRILGPAGPTLAANRLHAWVWSAAANLWDDGHYIAAVDAAYKKVELQTQQKLRASRRRSGANLFAQAFSLEDPKPDAPRLRFPHIDRAEALETWKSAHEGAMHMGMGCAKGIRNSLAHPTEDTSEIGEDEKQEALEQLAALSVLARWVDACEVVVAS